jgi:hypothetical protein
VSYWSLAKSETSFKNFYLFIFEELWIEPRASHMLDEHCITELLPSPIFKLM